MNSPADQPERDRFIDQFDRNFSVIAAAGSGKTRAITDRLIKIAQSAHALEWLPTLVVVTFTNRAADEMQARARQSLLEAGVNLDVLAAFSRAFFGTIHSFCVRLLHQHGHHLGLGGQFETINDDESLWMEFVQQHTAIATDLSRADRDALLRLVPVRQLMELGRSGGCGRFPNDAPEVFPPIDFSGVYGFEPDKRSQAPIERSQENLRRWEKSWATGEGFAPLPICESKPLGDAWSAAVGPIRRWACHHAHRVAAQVEHDYREFRLTRGVLGYDDQVALALSLMRHPEAAARVRAKNYRVILDEAQDTDPSQFSVLLEAARPPGAAGNWPNAKTDPPRAGHFCMVGDFQQSIYGDRADLAHYKTIHQALVEIDPAASVEFSVTFRLDQHPIEFVNATFPTLLTGTAGQARYVRLQPRPNVLTGQVLRWEPPDLPAFDALRDRPKAHMEATRLAKWLRNCGCEKLRVEHWREVAVLCPRKDWFYPLRSALRSEGFAVQLQSERDVKGESPAYAWFTALAVVMVEPSNSYEVVGVLREIFGLSDHDLAFFAEGFGTRFDLTQPPQSGLVGETLCLLAELRERITTRPLFDAMREIVRATKLRDRLLLLPADEYENLDSELADLLTLAAVAEADGQTLVEFASALRDGMTKTREVRGTTGDPIQLITSHKAKGSEWQCVIVPMFARSIHSGRSSYPRFVRIGGETRVALSRADLDPQTDEALKLADRQEAERLLYVSLTRAKHTLVLAHDHELFELKSGVSESAQARVLRTTVKKGRSASDPEANVTAFLALPTEATICKATTAHQSARTAHKAKENAVLPLEALPATAAQIAKARATQFIKRNPSALAEAALAEASPTAYPSPASRGSIPNAGQLYGTWWHGFVERLDWQADCTAWDATFADSLVTSPEVEVSRREWARLREKLAPDADLARLLTAPGLVVHAELPFLWRMNERECLEGIIDLAVFDPAKNSWLILDWKTNRTGLDELLTHYAPQLAAYWQMLTQTTGAKVNAGLYSTARGVWLPYEARMLADTWARIASNPAELTVALEMP